MMVYSSIMLVLYVSAATGQGLFYTDSSENEHPRIGKRQRHELISGTKYHNTVYSIPKWFNLFKQGTVKRGEDSIKMSPLDLILKIFDSNDDGEVTRKEMWSRWKDIVKIVPSISDIEWKQKD